MVISENNGKVERWKGGEVATLEDGIPHCVMSVEPISQTVEKQSVDYDWL